jgi:predicted secreted Zn-dependent protease
MNESKGRFAMHKKMMQRFQRGFALIFTSFLCLTAQASAQTRDVIEVSYYKIKGGYKAEWLELYKKNHLPILQDHQKVD